MIQLVLPWTAEPTAFAEEPPAATQYGKAELLGTLDSPPFHESSGIAVSRITNDVFWTHNDSGDKPRLYAIDRHCQLIATCDVQGAGAVDWEDIASFRLDNKPYLLVGDFGDNLKRRKVYELYLIPEPDLPAEEVRVARTISYGFDGDSHDCEAIGVDVKSRSILLVTKTWKPYCDVYQLTLLDRGDNEDQLAEKIATLKLGGITGMDVSPDGLRAILVSYTNAYEFRRDAKQSWSEAFAAAPRTLEMPAREQGESICYGLDGITLFLTSETKRRPVPLFQVAPAKRSAKTSVSQENNSP